MKYVVVFCFVAVIVGGASIASAQPDQDASADPAAWSPKADDRERFAMIMRVNIFLAERPRIVERAPREPVTTEEARDPLPPPDPDRHKVLVGVSLLGEGDQRRPVMFIEDRTTGEVTRLTHLGPFSRGEVIAADLNGLTYIVGDEERHVRIGQSLTGEAPGGAPPVTRSGSGVTGPPAPDGPPTDANGDAAANPDESELLQRLRERRNRE